jgi:hypothetical protein
VKKYDIVAILPKCVKLNSCSLDEVRKNSQLQSLIISDLIMRLSNFYWLIGDPVDYDTYKKVQSERNIDERQSKGDKYNLSNNLQHKCVIEQATWTGREPSRDNPTS